MIRQENHIISRKTNRQDKLQVNRIFFPPKLETLIFYIIIIFFFFGNTIRKIEIIHSILGGNLPF